ncbi:MAG: ABC transporter permease subunit [Eubacteriales bacterium]|nr:ABC transporter permease subunit [Eubacteriales bacterium]
MTVFAHEIRRGRVAFWIWTGVIVFMMVMCMFLYPEMKTQMQSVNDLFAGMGSFTAAFGMDKVSFGEVMGFYAIEGGNMLGIGGGFFAAFLGIGMLAKEEKERTAEFLLSHPVTRTSVVFQKLLAVAVQIIVMNLIVIIGSVVSFKMIKEELPVTEFALLHIAFLVMQLEIACICFAVSAFLRRGSMGIGLGLAAVMYFLNIICNLSDKAEALKYITPFAYAEASDIVADAAIDGTLMGLGIAYGVIGAAVAWWWYRRKDIVA